jgi:hypothetical protein
MQTRGNGCSHPTMSAYHICLVANQVTVKENMKLAFLEASPMQLSPRFIPRLELPNRHLNSRSTLIL